VATGDFATHLRNIAIIAHVDHGKTTLVDALLASAGIVGDRHAGAEAAAGSGALVMDSDPLERERGITIFSKQCAVDFVPADSGPVRINIVDTPGHADFGGEVERVLRMVDGALLLVDAFEGPMPQTRFVLEKALAAGLRILVVVNKCDRPDARPDAVIDAVFDLLVALGADDETLDFNVIFASAKNGWASHDPTGGTDMRPLLEAIVQQLPAPPISPDEPLQMLITSVDWSDYVGRIAIGRVVSGGLKAGSRVAVCRADGSVAPGRALKTLRLRGLGRESVPEIGAGDLCAIEGLDVFDIGDTICDPGSPRPLTRVSVDEPTVHMVFRANDSPGGGTEGQFVTARQIEDRLRRETNTNVALRVESGDSPDEFRVSGRGLLHLGILIENMRREGFELTVGRPEVVVRDTPDGRLEPVERITVHVPSDGLGPVMELLGARGAEIQHVEPRGDRMHLEAEMPARELIGLRPRIMTATGGDAVMDHAFSRWAPVRPGERRRPVGVMTTMEGGQARAYALEQLGERGIMFVSPAEPVYAGQIVGENSRAGDLDVNVTKNKAHSNVRESNKEATVVLKTPRRMGLEEALEYIEDDELVEVTPKAIRLRKRLLDATARKRQDRRRRSEG
jgi:GTP-binding protein